MKWLERTKDRQVWRCNSLLLGSYPQNWFSDHYKAGHYSISLPSVSAVALYMLLGLCFDKWCQIPLSYKILTKRLLDCFHFWTPRLNIKNVLSQHLWETALNFQLNQNCIILISKNIKLNVLFHWNMKIIYIFRIILEKCRMSVDNLPQISGFHSMDFSFALEKRWPFADLQSSIMPNKWMAITIP